MAKTPLPWISDWRASIFLLFLPGLSLLLAIGWRRLAGESGHCGASAGDVPSAGLDTTGQKRTISVLIEGLPADAPRHPPHRLRHRGAHRARRGARTRAERGRAGRARRPGGSHGEQAAEATGPGRPARGLPRRARWIPAVAPGRRHQPDLHRRGHGRALGDDRMQPGRHQLRHRQPVRRARQLAAHQRHRRRRAAQRQPGADARKAIHPRFRGRARGATTHPRPPRHRLKTQAAPMATQIIDTPAEPVANREIHEQLGRRYDAGFVTDIESDSLPPGLDEDTIRALSAIKEEPEWMTEWRLSAYRHWLTMPVPRWAKLRIAPIDFQAISYYSAPKGPKYASLDEVPQELLDTYDKLGVPLHERAKLAGVAVDAVFDSVSVGTTFRKELADKGIIFCSMSEAIKDHPELVKQYIGSVVPPGDNYFAALNSAVFSDGSFVFIPEGVKCPMELSTYFRINAGHTGQFERTLIICEDRAQVSYLEGCTAPVRDENQLHAAVVELVALEDAEIKYSTVQNWYPGDEEGRGGIYNFVTKRGECRGANSKISWTQVETGSAITWKYPSCILRGENSVGEFYSVAVTNNHQQADTGTKMIHIGRNTTSTIVSKGISAGHGQNAYRGLVKIGPGAEGARNFTQCDSLLIGDRCAAHTFPYIENRNKSAIVEHEATTSKVSDEQMFLCRQRGIDPEQAVSMIVNGFCKEVFQELPMEFAVEAEALLSVTLEGSVG